MTPELFEQIKEEVAAGYIRAVTEDNLTIYNYTPQTQWSKHWNEATRMCRGLILDPDGNIVARPFPKFFNWGETPELHDRIDEEVEVTWKYDGSLGILYPHPSGEVRVATRGSFTSEQALWATNWLHSKLPDLVLPDGVTPLVEIVYPQNRIVVDYKGLEGLFGLAFLDNESGADIEGDYWDDWDPIKATPAYKETLGAIAAYYEEDPAAALHLGEEEEGEVVRFLSDDVRVKFKYSDYVRLHKLVTGTHARNIWEHLSKGDSMEYVLDKVPDEFYKWARNIMTDLRYKHGLVLAEALVAFQEIANLPTRKEFAAAATQTKVPDILFAMLDDKPYDYMIWKRLKPAADRPFKTEEE